MDSAAIPITEKLLSGAGGWQAMKAARELVKAGRVSGATYEPPLLAGEVREGQKTYRAGLRIRTRDRYRKHLHLPRIPRVGEGLRAFARRRARLSRAGRRAAVDSG